MHQSPDVPHSRAHHLATLTWQHALIVVAMLGFFAFVLWLTASQFDASEVKTLLGTAIGITAREFWPVVRQLLGPMTKTFDGHID